ncbi:helix-turn-helix domain-containing protein [Prosthecobacter sp. SYSU 5D2]|uniref:winged helix-turn-helix transcriptional regulator n=1 Tax=Prosthecobacter sp. SYSU 5D2 TaxID=3134134 RepID=UPI0031FEDA72
MSVVKPRKKNEEKPAQSGGRRSPCPVACTLDILGDRWTLLVIRDLLLGKARFKDFLASPEGIPTNILTERLKRLLEHEVVCQVRDAGGSRHLAYALTDKGTALLPVVRAMKDWGLAWEEGTRLGLVGD